MLKQVSTQQSLLTRLQAVSGANVNLNQLNDNAQNRNRERINQLNQNYNLEVLVQEMEKQLINP